MTNAPRVLVVDGLAETEAVLRAVLEPQGAAVERRRSALDASAAAPPQVMVVDLDDDTHDHRAWPDVPRILVGSARLDEESGERFLEKPFHYPDLVRMVESLLDLPSEDRRVM